MWHPQHPEHSWKCACRPKYLRISLQTTMKKQSPPFIPSSLLKLTNRPFAPWKRVLVVRLSCDCRRRNPLCHLYLPSRHEMWSTAAAEATTMPDWNQLLCKSLMKNYMFYPWPHLWDLFAVNHLLYPITYSTSLPIFSRNIFHLIHFLWWVKLFAIQSVAMPTSSFFSSCLPRELSLAKISTISYRVHDSVSTLLCLFL